MNDLLIDLIVGFLDSTMSFADFVNHLNWNRTLDKASIEKTLINLSHTNRTWSYYARLVLRRRVVVFDGAFGLRQYFRQGESASQRPWVREVYFAMKNRQGRRSIEHAARLLAHLFQTCPNVEELFIYTCFRSQVAPFVPVIRSLGDLHHLKALWLQHNYLHNTYMFTPNLSDFLAVLPKLQRLERLFIGRWEPYNFNEAVGAWRHYESSLNGGSDDDLKFSPPESLKTVSLTSLSYFGFLGGDPTAYSWLISPAVAHNYVPTALAFDSEDLDRPLNPIAGLTGPRFFFECAQHSMPFISRLRLYNYAPDHTALLVNILERCNALEHLSLILQGWATRESRGLGVVLENDDPLLPFSMLPKSVRELHIHLENVPHEWHREHDLLRDRMLVHELEIAPQLKKVIISRAPLQDDIGHLRTFELTSNHCATMGIDLRVLDTLSPPLF